MNKDYMLMALEKASEGVGKGYGGPFGATVTDSFGNVLAVSCNTVLKDNDATCHAEMNAIREASKKLGSYNLDGCIIYATSEPCPMCMSAIIWANIKVVYYGCSRDDTEKIGFRDQMIYEYFNGSNKEVAKMIQIARDDCMKLHNDYKDIIY